MDRRTMGLLTKLYLRWIRDRVSLTTLATFVVSIGVFTLTLDRQPLFVRVINLVAAGLVPVCLVSILWEFFVRKAFLDYVKEVLRMLMEESLADRLHRFERRIGDRFDGFERDIVDRTDGFERRMVDGCATSSVFARFGVTEMFANRDDVDLPGRLRRARERIWILVTAFGYLTEPSDIIKALQEQGKRGKVEKEQGEEVRVDIRLLGLKLKGESMSLRCKFHRFYAKLKKEAPLFLDTLKRDLAECGGRAGTIQLRLYDIIPTAACFFIDDTLYFSILLLGERSRNCVHFGVKKYVDGSRSKLYKEFEEHFKECFKRAKKEEW